MEQAFVNVIRRGFWWFIHEATWDQANALEEAVSASRVDSINGWEEPSDIGPLSRILTTIYLPGLCESDRDSVWISFNERYWTSPEYKTDHLEVRVQIGSRPADSWQISIQNLLEINADIATACMRAVERY